MAFVLLPASEIKPALLGPGWKPPAPSPAKQELCPQGLSAELVWLLFGIESTLTGLSHRLL